MNKIENYSNYQNYYNSTVKTKKEEIKTEKKEETKKTQSLNLSTAAKDLLEELKKTYKNVDFIVADYETDEEAAQYLAKATKEYGVVIEPDLLEEMAADEETKEKYTKIIEDSTSQLSQMKEQLTDEEKENVKFMGISVDKDGVVTYFAELEKANEKQQKRLEKVKEKKAEKEEKAEKLQQEKEKSKKVKISANSIEELFEKIRNVNWDEVKEEEKEETKTKINYII